MTRRIGIYSGTFDPVHAGHIAFALEAADVCGLEAVYFLPEMKPRTKQHVTTMVHRIALLEHALAGHDSLKVMQLKSQQFSVTQTLPEIQTTFGDADITLLVGSDIVCGTFSSWINLDVLLNQVSLAVGLRDTNTPEQVEKCIMNINTSHRLHGRYVLIETAHAGLNSTLIRHNRHDYTQLAPDAARYIREKRLYKNHELDF